MKKLIFAIALLLGGQSLHAQYFCSDKGTVLHYVNYDGAGQSTSNVTATVKNVKNEGSLKKADYVTKIVTNKAKNNTSYTLYNWSYDGTNTNCQEDLVYGAYIKSNSDPDQYDTAARTVFRNEMKYKGDNTFSLINDAKAGTSIADRTYSTVENMIRTEVKISGAAYMGTEEVNTTAGTFHCVKISYLKRTKVVVKSTTTRVTEWYAVGIGLVKSESYDTKGNPTAKTLLVKIEK